MAASSSNLPKDLSINSVNQFAVIVGCNYPNTNDELSGCINDAVGMKETLMTRFGFSQSCIDLLTDEPGSKLKPTRAVIKEAIERMISRARPGDILVFFFSGHGFSEQGLHCICATDDFNMLTSVDFRMFVNRVPEGAPFIIIADSCNSGGLIDKEKVQIGPHQLSPLDMETIEAVPVSATAPAPAKAKHITPDEVLNHLATLSGLDSPSLGDHLIHVFGSENVSPMFTLPANKWPMPLKPDQGILLSGCEPNELSDDIYIDGKSQGAFTYAIQLVLKNHPGPITNSYLVQRARTILASKNIRGIFHGKSYHQHPCLYCSDHNARAFFLCKPR